MKRIVLFLCTLLFANTVYGNTWTVFMYMDSSDKFSDIAIKNITDTVLASVPDNVTIVIQLHAFGTTAYRYCIKKNALVPLEPMVLGKDRVQNLVDGMLWAFGAYPADHTMIIFWDHGYGALEPQWNVLAEKWEFEPDVKSTANKLDSDDDIEGVYAPCSLRAFNVELHKRHRGFMFDAVSHEYLTNNDLVEAFKTITTSLGHTVDIVAFDTCMGGMVEIAYQFQLYAQYLVGVQSCASKDGFNYRALGEVFDDPQKTPRAVAASMVKTFDDCYTAVDADGINTLTAFDLTAAGDIKSLIDQSALLLHECTKIYGTKAIRKALRVARSQCYRVCLFTMYADFYTLISVLNQQLALLESIKQTKQLHDLRSTLDTLCATTKKAVVAHYCGNALKDKAHGIAIYFPDYHIDSSYAQVPFGRDLQWASVLALAAGLST